MGELSLSGGVSTDQSAALLFITRTTGTDESASTGFQTSGWVVNIESGCRASATIRMDLGGRRVQKPSVLSLVIDTLF